MIKILDLAQVPEEEIFARQEAAADVSGPVADILRDVKARGDAALLDCAKKFDRAELTALEFCTGLEKWEREDLCALLEETVEQVCAGLGRSWEPRRAMALVGRLEEVRRSLDFHVGAGHVAGWLCAGSFQIRDTRYPHD